MIALLATLALAAPPNDAPATVRPSDWEYRFKAIIGGLATWDSEEETTPSLSLIRARPSLSGRYTRNLSWKLSAAFGDFEPRLRHAWINVRAYKRHLQMRVGRFKRPFSIMRLTSFHRQGGIDRGLASNALGSGYDLGAALHNGFRDAKAGFHWTAGAFAEDRLVLAGRVGWASEGMRAYRQTDQSRGGLRWSAAAGVQWFGKRAAKVQKLELEVDAMLKAHGLTVAAQLGQSLVDDQQTLSLHSHVGYRIIPELEPVLRYDSVFPDTGAMEQEAVLGLNAYLFENHLRATLDGAWLDRVVLGTGAAAAQSGYRVRFMLLVM
ncbi:MAG: hypothetical protein ACI9WU_003016 [Myxococcota bacterium]|jgi:hypothetical protein